MERQIDVLKYQKAAMSQNDYEQQLKALLVGLARIQAELDNGSIRTKWAHRDTC